jgi:hypothetical protein
LFSPVALPRVPVPTTRVPGSQREKLWREFFSNPLEWWDGRHEKVIVI